MLDGLIKLIEYRMRELGYSKFHIDFIRVRDAGASLDVPAHNEYWWLVAKSTKVPVTMKIISDAEVLAPADAAGYADYTFYGMKEFSGHIRIETGGPAGIDLEFVRVVPEN